MQELQWCNYYICVQIVYINLSFSLLVDCNKEHCTGSCIPKLKNVEHKQVSSSDQRKENFGKTNLVIGKY